MSIFNPLYWLSISPLNVSGNTVWILFGVGLLLLVSGFVVPFVLKKRFKDTFLRKGFEQISTALITMGLIGLFLVFCSYERANFLGGRFWYPLWIIGAVVWKIFIIKYFYKDVPKKRIEKNSRVLKQEYLPPQKRKKR